MNDEKFDKIMLCCVFVVAFVCASLCLLFGGCSTARADAPNLVLEHQRQIDSLESTIGRYDAAVGDAIAELDAIAERSAGMAGDIDEIIRLFDEYQSRVERLLYELDALRSETTDTDANNNNSRRDNFN